MPRIQAANGEQQDKVFTAPLAIIYFGNLAVGKMMNITFTENLVRQDGRELGSVYSFERPLTSINCTFTAQSAQIDMKRFGSVPNEMWPLNATTPAEFANTLLFGDTEVEIKVFSKVPTAREGGLVVATAEEEMGTIRNAVLDSRSFNIANDQIVTQNLSGSYLKPMGV